MDFDALWAAVLTGAALGFLALLAPPRWAEPTRLLGRCALAALAFAPVLAMLCDSLAAGAAGALALLGVRLALLWMRQSLRRIADAHGV